MSRANDVRPGMGPGGANAPGQAPTLQEIEAEKAKQQQIRDRVSSADAQRIAQQAGFEKARKKQKKKFDIGDSSRAPIPIPDDENDDDAWSQETLDGAQENLVMAGALFEESKGAQEAGTNFAEVVVSSSYMPTDSDVQRMQILADRAAPTPVPLEEVSSNVKQFFNIDLGDDVPVGHKVLATGLVVAGEAGAVKVEKGKLDEKELVAGVQQVTQKGNQAVGEAKEMGKRINHKLNEQRTFVFKR